MDNAFLLEIIITELNLRESGKKELSSESKEKDVDNKFTERIVVTFSFMDLPQIELEEDKENYEQKYGRSCLFYKNPEHFIEQLKDSEMKIVVHRDGAVKETFGSTNIKLDYSFIKAVQDADSASFITEIMKNGPLYYPKSHYKKLKINTSKPVSKNQYDMNLMAKMEPYSRYNVWFLPNESTKEPCPYCPVTGGCEVDYPKLPYPDTDKEKLNERFQNLKGKRGKFIRRKKNVKTFNVMEDSPEPIATPKFPIIANIEKICSIRKDGFEIAMINLSLKLICFGTCLEMPDLN